MYQMKKVIFIFFSITILSCSKEQYNQQLVRPANCDSTRFTFEKQVRPIFNSNCNFNECHATGGAGSYDFTNYAVVKNRVQAGVVDYRLDLPSDDKQHMPFEMRLSDCDYYIIKIWIKQGFPEN
jgi:hypothetical protein